MPSPARPAEVAEALKNALNAADPGTFSQAFTAVRKYVPAADLAALKDLTVTVFAGASDREQLNRHDVDKRVRVDVGIQKRMPAGCDGTKPEDNEHLDPMVQLAEEVADFLGPELPALDLGGGVTAQWVETRTEPIYSIEHLREKHTFTSVARVTFQLL